MKRELDNMDFFQCPQIELGDNRNVRNIQETGLPYYPTSDSDALRENSEPVSGTGKLKKALTIAAIVAFVALLVGVGLHIALTEF